MKKPVRVLVTSDLTFGATAKDAVATLAGRMAATNPDAVVIAGNLGETVGELRTTLALMKKAFICPVAFVPGNQDLFFQEKISSHDLWTFALRQVVEDHGVSYLQGSTLELNGVVLLGSIGWYDYSAAHPDLPRTQEAWIQTKLENNVADAMRIDWEWSDPEFASLVGKTLQANLESVEQDHNVREVAVITHYPVFPWQIIATSGNDDRESQFTKLLQAYHGNYAMGFEIMCFPKVSAVVSGHVGTAGDQEIPRAQGKPIRSYLTGSSASHPGYVEILLGNSP